MSYYLYQFNTDNHHEPIWLRKPLEVEDKRYPLMLQFAGYSRCYEGWENYRKKSDIYAIEYVCAGNAVLVQSGRKNIVNKGEVFLLHKDAEHAYSVGPAGFLLKRFIAIDGVELENLLRLLGLWGKDTIIPREPGKIKKLIKRFTDMISSNPAEDLGLQYSGMVYEFLLVLSQSLERGIPLVIEKAVEFIQQNLHKSLSRDDLGDFLGISVAHLNRLFFVHFGCSPIKYFIDRKLTWSAHMLINTRYSIKEITAFIGYDDPLYFSSRFKKKFGVSPREYRLAHVKSPHSSNE